MGNSAAVFYGYDLGGEEDGWTFVTYDEDEDRYNWPEWMELDDGDDLDDPVTQMLNRVFTHLSDFEEIPVCESKPDDYYEKLHAARAEVGIESDMYGIGDWTGYVLGFKVAAGYNLTVLDKDAFDLDFAFMDARLRAVTEILGVEFKDQPQPQLLLVSSYF